METREQITYNKVVNIAEDGEITVLDYVFKHSNNFKGAVGSNFYPISEKQFKRGTTLNAVTEYLKSAVNEGEIPGGYGSYRQWAKAIIEAGEEQDLMFDQSYAELWDYLRETTGLTEKEAYIFECVGGGRCFDKYFQGNVNPELSEIIRQYESE